MCQHSADVGWYHHPNPPCSSWTVLGAAITHNLLAVPPSRRWWPGVAQGTVWPTGTAPGLAGT